MTAINKPPNPEPEKKNLFQHLANKLKSSPKKTAGGVIAIAALGSLGYWGLDVLVKKKLPPFLETQIGNLIKRPIDLGEVKGFSLSGIEFGKTVISPTATDPDKVTVKGVKIGFNVFPVLFRRTLPLDVTLMQPDLYLEQEKDGQWVNLDFLASDPNKQKKAPLVYFDVDLDVEQADIAAVPYEQNPLHMQVDGNGRFNQKTGFLDYDFDIGVEQAKASIKGKTELKTGMTNTKLQVKDLALSAISPLLPVPLTIATGVFNADLDINIPSFEKIATANVKGTLSVQNATGRATDLDAPVSAESKLNFSGRNAEIKETQASLGDITAQVDGKVNLDSGYDLDAVILPFQLASLPPGITQQLPVNLAGEVEARVKLRGAIKQPKLTGSINNTQTVTIDKTQFAKINADFRADLAKVVLENVRVNPVTGGSITAEGTVQTNIDRALERGKAIDFSTMPLAFSFVANLPTQELITPYYQLPERVAVGSLDARGQIDGTVKNLKGNIKWNLARDPNLEDIAGSGEAILADNKLSLRNTEITYGDGKADVVADANLDNKQWQANIDANSLDLTPFLNQVDNPNLNLDRLIAVETAKINLNGKLDRLDLAKIQGNADANLNLDGGVATVNSQLNSGMVRANAIASQINLNRFLPNLPVPANIRWSKVTASAELQQLLAFDLSTIDAQVNADLDVAEGTVKAIASLASDRWQANVDAYNISSQLLLAKFAPENLASVDVDNIDARLDLTGNINPLVNNELNVPITVNQFAVNSGVQTINAQGDLTLTDVTKNLDVRNSNLDVAANLDFDRLPVDSILAATTQNNSLVAENVNIKGKAAFNGQFRGKQLLSAPNKINLTGDLRLQNFAFNDIVFDPEMTGYLIIQPGSEIALNLKGKQDVIAASAVPCTENRCKLPYLPTNLELRQGENTDNPIVATGERSGDKFNLDINNFPLALLNIAPGKPAGIKGALGGMATGNVALNLYTLAAQGAIEINKPGVGYIQADRLDANFNYDPANNIAEITTSSLDLGNSKYNFSAALNLESAKIDGKLDIPQAYIQDILTTLRWFTIEDVINLFNIPDYASAAAFKPDPGIDLVERSIARILNKLGRINNLIQANAALKEAGNIPTELDIQGKYTGEVILGGTIQAPQTDFQVDGSNWEWQPTAAYPDIVPPLGLVIEESQFISIPKLLLKGSSYGTQVDLGKSELQIEDAVMSLQGKLSPENLDTKFTVANLTVDDIANFVKIPVDLAGKINSAGTISGSLQKPQIEGKITFTEGALNGDILPAEIAGKFNYNGTKLSFNTTAPDSIQVKASVPYPIIPGSSDRAYFKADLDKEAFVFLGALSQNYLNWIDGEGNAKFEADARLDLNRMGVIYDLNADGVVDLKDANINIDTPFFSENFVGTGKIILNNQIVNVETLKGTFAEKDVTAKGKFPILTAVKNLDNPLTIDLPQTGDIKIEKLYKGGIDGTVTVTGASLTPVIGGKVNLKDGIVSIPQAQQSQQQPIQIAKNKSSSSSNINSNKASDLVNERKQQQTNNSSSVITALKDLRINLKNFKLEQTPLYKFQLDGSLLLNGTADVPTNIRPEGTLTFTCRGDTRGAKAS